MRRSHSPLAYAALGFIPFSLMAVAACSTAAQPVPPSTPGSGMCTADGLDQYVGQPRTAELGQRIKTQSGARELRWLPKGTVVTMEYREDRVNVRLDERNRVESVNCG